MQSKQDKYEDFLNHLPVSASDKALMALKGHLLVEQALREFIYKRVPKPERLKDKQINFAHLLDFATALDDSDSMSWVWEAARKLNNIRNKLSHHLSFEKIDELESKFIYHVQAHDGEVSIKVGNDTVDYQDFPLAIFQVYDRIISYPYFPPRRLGWSDFEISSAVSRAAMAIESMPFAQPQNKGPKPRKKWAK